MGYPRPNDFFDTNPERLREIRDEVKNDVETFTGQIAGLKRKKKTKNRRWKEWNRKHSNAKRFTT